MLKYSGKRPQRKKRHRPEYTLIPRVAPNIRAYVPEKPVQRSGVYQDASQNDGNTDEMKRPVNMEKRNLPSEPVGREAHAKGGETQYGMCTDTMRESVSGDMDEDRENTLLESRMAKKEYVPRHAAPEDMDDIAIPESAARAYVPRHAALEEGTFAVALKPDTNNTKHGHKPTAAVEDSIDMSETQPGTSAVPLRVVDESVYGEEGYETSEEYGHSTSHNQVRKAIKKKDKAAKRSHIGASKLQPGTSAVPLRVVDESVYGEAGYGAQAGREDLPLRNRPYRLGESPMRVEATASPISGKKASKRPRRRKAAPRRPASGYAEKPVNSGKRKGRIILLSAGLAVTIALLIALMLPGGWLTRETPPLSTVATSQLFTDEGGDENAAGAVSTPTATPDATATATGTATATVTATATATVSATATTKATATAKPVAAPKPTAKPTATAQPTATQAPTATSTVAPTATPTVAPTTAPTATPTVAPTTAPTATPTSAPTATPTQEPSAETTTP